jgi:protein TonB
MITTEAQSSGKNRLAGIMIVVLIHIAAGYAVFSGLGKAMISVLPKSMETRVIQDKQSNAPPPVAPPDLVAPPPPQINLALPSFAVTRPPAANAITQPAPAAPAPAPAPAPLPIAPPKPRVEVPPVVNPDRACTTPVYPTISRRLNEVGSVTLMMLIDVNGRVVETQVKTSSGYPRLDQAAREAVISCHFKPGTVDGQPTAAWSLIRYQFNPGQ